MIPLPQILAEFVMALGGALVVAMGLVLVRLARAGDTPPEKPVARGRVIANLLIGLLVFVWGFASFVTGLGKAR